MLGPDQLRYTSYDRGTNRKISNIKSCPQALESIVTEDAARVKWPGTHSRRHGSKRAERGNLYPANQRVWNRRSAPLPIKVKTRLKTQEPTQVTAPRGPRRIGLPTAFLYAFVEIGIKSDGVVFSSRTQ